MTHLSSPVTPRTNDEQRLTRAELALPFRVAEKPASAHRIGVEAEKFGLLLPDYAPLPYEGERSITALLKGFVRRGYREERERPEGPVIALHREQNSITLEPGAQLEFSGSPQTNLHEVAYEIRQHLEDLAKLAETLGIVFCSTGFHPLATQEALPWVPKLRYAIMREYLPRLGDGALDMMRRTATLQVNFDYSSERDALRKLRLLLRLSPIIQAITANSPFKEGALFEQNSLRGDVWTRMDPSRSGLIERLWNSREPTYDDYIEWALDAGMFLFKRHGEIIANTGQTFRDFLRRGYQGHLPTMSDWQLHLNTLFPEVRLKNTLELRSCDAQPTETMMAIPALGTGFLYDDIALTQAESLAERYDWQSLNAARPALIRQGYGTRIGDEPLEQLAQALVEIAQGGLLRRARLDDQGRDETQYLHPLMQLIEQRKTPSMLVRERLNHAETVDVSAIVEATRII